MNGWLTYFLNLLGMGAGAATPTTGGTVCATFSCASAIDGTLSADAAIGGTFSVEEC